jgi:hypothetical protein
MADGPVVERPRHATIEGEPKWSVASPANFGAAGRPNFNENLSLD